VKLINNNQENTINDTEYLEYLIDLTEKYCEDMTRETGDLECSNFTILDSKITLVDGKKAYQIKYFRTLTDSTGDVVPIINISTEIPNNDHLWIIDAGFHSMMQSDFTGEINSSINSFKIKSDKTSILTGAPKSTETKNDINTQAKDTAKNESSVKPTIPDWIKNNAGWWADGSIDDKSFIEGLQFLIKEGTLKVSNN
jgi:hypothetical protein